MITIEIPIYYSRLHIFLDEADYSKKKISKCVRNWFVKETDYNKLTSEFNKSYEKSIKEDNCGGVTIFNSGLYIIALRKYNTTPKIFSILIHELLHVVFEVMRSKNIVESDSSTECYTYFMEWLTEEALNKIGKYETSIETTA